MSKLNDITRIISAVQDERESGEYSDSEAVDRLKDLATSLAEQIDEWRNWSLELTNTYNKKPLI